MLLRLLFYITLALLSDARQRCRCLPSDPCWPSNRAWSTLEQNLSQPLLHTRPLASVCHQSSSEFNPSACSTVQANFHDPIYRSGQPNAVQFTVWEQIITNSSVQQCVPDPQNASDACFQGRVPFAAVNVTKVEDIQAAVRFASAHDLKLVVKNTGHENLGRSFGIGSLSIWTHHLKDIQFDDSFVPTGAPATTKGLPSVTIQPGVQWGELYNAASDHNRVVVGGIGATGSVGAGGGWIMGAGHSILSPFYGLGVDNVLQLSVVLPNASHVFASTHVNPDLFWALRGGGGPSFGVLTSVTYKTHDAIPVTAAFFQGTTNSSEARLALMQQWVEDHPAFSDAGWAGFWPYDNESLWLTLMAQGDPPSNPKANATLQSFFDTVSAIPGVNVSLAVTKPYSGFHSWYEDNFINSTNGIGFNYTVGDFAGVTVSVASRLIPHDTFENNASALAEALVQIPEARPFLVGGGAVSQVDPDSASCTPAFRTMLSDITLALVWDEHATVPEIEALRQNVTGWADLLRDITPDGGAYVNEPDGLEIEWQQAYWGKHYPRLQALKRAVDPHETFIVYKGVNSEPWDTETICRTI